MDMNKLTIKAQETIQEAVNLARRTRASVGRYPEAG